MSQENKPFSVPQNQSALAIAVFFTNFFYRLFRGGGWVALVFILRKGLNSSSFYYIIIGSIVLTLLSVIYGILAFLKFQFHINFEQREFIVQKGVFTSDRIVVPFDKIQHVYLKRSLIQRLLNVYRLKIDTAGSSKDEVDIKALSKQDALFLKKILMQLEALKDSDKDYLNEPKETTGSQVGSSPLKWVYRLSNTTLLKIGLTSNWFRGVWILLLFVNQIYQQIKSLATTNQWLQDFEGFLKGFQGILQILVILAIALFLLIFIGMLITLSEVFLKYYNLKVERQGDSLSIQMGLTTTQEFALKARRVQLLKIKTNPVQKRLNLFSSDLHLGNSQGDLKKTKITLPGLERQTVDKIKAFLYAKELAKVNCFRPNKAILIRRLFWLSLPLVIMWSLPAFIDNFDFNFLVFTVISVLYALPVYWFQNKVYQSYTLHIDDDFITKRHGVWNQKTEIIEFYKLQGITIKQPIWFKKRGIETVKFHTAGGDLTFPLIKKAEWRSRLNHIIYTVETTAREWM